MKSVARRRDAQSTVELAIGLPVLLAVILGALSFFMAEQARTAVIDAARSAARLASIECGNGVASWQADAEAAVASALGGGGLHVGGFRAPSPQNPRGSWYAGVTCSNGFATASVYYNEVDLFPPLADLIEPGSGPGSTTFYLHATVVFPLE